MSEVIPEGWVNTNLLSICSVKTGKVDANHAIENGKYTFFTCAFEPLKADTYSFEGDLIILPGNGANVGHVGFYQGKIEAYQRTYVLHDFAVSPKFVYLNLLGNWRKVNQEKQFGSATNYIKMGNFEDYKLPLPPLAEQKVIADKLDELLAQVESTKARLDAIPAILKSFRQSVLAAAVCGKLTEEWRGMNDITANWQNVQLSTLLSKLRSGSGDKPNDDVRGVPILRSSAVRPRKIDYSDIKYLQNIDDVKVDNYLQNGDLIFTRLSGSAEYVGNCALVKNLLEKYQYPDRLFCARLKDQNNATYLEYFCSSNIFREHIANSIKSSAGHQRITLDAIKTALINIPAQPEQIEIVRRVEELFAFADKVEAQVNAAQARVNNLTQSILAKAFRGELTADWRAANPESISGENSAEALLERIKSEREDPALAAKAAKKKPRAKKAKA